MPLQNDDFPQHIHLRKILKTQRNLNEFATTVAARSTYRIEDS